MLSSFLLEAIQTLKRIPRSGWIYAGIPLADVETVAEHSFGVAFLSLLLATEIQERGDQIDVAKTLKMAILHDAGESLTFDISKRYLDYIGARGRKIKQEIDTSANRRLLSGLSPRQKRQTANLLRELESVRSMEARVVEAADRLDLLFQLTTYMERGYRSKLLAEMHRKAIAEIKAMKDPVFNSVLKNLPSRKSRGE